MLSSFEISSLNKKIIYLTSLTIVFASSFVIIAKSIRLLLSLRINSLNFNSAEIRIDEGVSKSILNHHLDEILYFFEVTSYNVVIIEDLDRFRQTEIFTKLRELNLLINNSKKTKKEVVFIYAVRDEMFIDKDRTKFFDFIIPIIPVINSSNSNEILSKELVRTNHKISNDLIDDISLFIDDLRLLYNISNEFQVYNKKLNQKLNQNNLLAIIVYKNIHPSDFVKLSHDDGVLFNTLTSKQTFINNEVDKIESEKVRIKNEIYELESLRIRNIKELRSLYVLKYISKNPNILSFSINHLDYDFDSVFEDNLFEHFINNSIKINTPDAYYRNQLNKSDPPQKFVAIEKEVDPEHTYKERFKLISDWNSNKVEDHKRTLDTLEKEIAKVKSSRIREVLINGNVQIEASNIRQNRLLSILIRNGYIDEDYLDYVSIFYEGSITKEDYQFLLNVKSQVPTEFDFRITKIENLIKKISEYDFDKYYILNFQLVNYILNNSPYKKKQDLIFSLLANLSDTSVKFIDGYIQFGQKPGTFLNELFKLNSGLWEHICTKSNFTKEKVELYFKLIIEHVDPVYMLFSSLKQTISENRNFLSTIKDNSKLESIIKNLTPKFIDLTFDNSSKVVFDFIYKGNFYQINEIMLTRIIQTYGHFNQADFETKNYFAIVNSICQQLIEYVENNIEEYIVNVYLRLDTNNEEPEETYISLLTNESITIESKKNLIKKVNTKITTMQIGTDQEIDSVLLKESKVEPKWEILIDYYDNNENKFDQGLCSFLNVKDNFTTLSHSKIPKEKPSKELCSKFISELLQENRIEIESYKYILKSIPDAYPSLEFGELSLPKVTLLVEGNILSFNQENYLLLQEKFPDLHTKFIIQNYSNFLDNFNLFELTPNAVIKILESIDLSNELKNKLITLSDESTLLGNNSILRYISYLIEERPSFEISKTLVKSIILKSAIGTLKKIKLFNIKELLFEKEDINEILISLPSPYAEIAMSGKRPLLEYNDENLNLVSNLKAKNYISNFKNEEKGIRISTFH